MKRKYLSSTQILYRTIKWTMDGINPHATVQKLLLDENDLRIQVPFSMSISGPSQSIVKKFNKY